MCVEASYSVMGWVWHGWFTLQDFDQQSIKGVKRHKQGWGKTDLNNSESRPGQKINCTLLTLIIKSAQTSGNPLKPISPPLCRRWCPVRPTSFPFSNSSEHRIGAHYNKTTKQFQPALFGNSQQALDYKYTGCAAQHSTLSLVCCLGPDNVKCYTRTPAHICGRESGSLRS